MAYDPTKEQTIVISKAAHTKLSKLAKQDKRTLRAYTDMLIEDTYAQLMTVTNKVT